MISSFWFLVYCFPATAPGGLLFLASLSGGRHVTRQDDPLRGVRGQDAKQCRARNTIVKDSLALIELFPVQIEFPSLVTTVDRRVCPKVGEMEKGARRLPP